MEPKNICAISLFLLLFFFLQGNAQHPVGYEYWIDGDFSGRRAVSSNNGLVSMDINADALTPGMHCFYFRAKDAHGRYTPVTTQYFYRTFSDKEGYKIDKYRYWIDGNYSSHKEVNISPVDLLQLQYILIDIEGNLNLPETIQDTVHVSVSSISNDIYLHFPRKSTLYLQFGDVTNRWSGIEVDTFYNEGLVKRSAISLPMNEEISIVKPDTNDIIAVVSETVQSDSIFWRCDQPCTMAIYNSRGELLRIATPSEIMEGLHVATNAMERYYALIYQARKEEPYDGDRLLVYCGTNETALFLPNQASNVKIYSHEGKIIVENGIVGKEILVYTDDGRIVSQRIIQKGREEIVLPPGIYIVTTSSTYTKVLI